MTQYQLTLAKNVGTTVPEVGSYWYDAGSTVTFTALPPRAILGQRYIFHGWTGSGSGSYTGTGNPGRVIMRGPITEKAAWTLVV